jgi:hypothetical protein
MHVCRVPIFRRVHGVSLDGPQYKSDLLPHLACFRDLRQLNLVNTSIQSSDLDAWKQQHSRVAVKVYGP